MKCPHCGAEARVFKVKARGDGFIVRRHRCTVCNRRFTTHQAVVDEQKSFTAPPGGKSAQTG